MPWRRAFQPPPQRGTAGQGKWRTPQLAQLQTVPCMVSLTSTARPPSVPSWWACSAGYAKYRLELTNTRSGHELLSQPSKRHSSNGFVWCVAIVVEYSLF